MYKFSKELLKNKNLLMLGDSQSAQATIGEGNKTYSTLFKEYFQMNKLINASIGGTTLTYTYEGSNIDKEYHDLENVLDCCRVVDKLENEKLLDDIDFVFISYGHNDQFFKPEIEEKHDEPIVSLSQCNSYKNSFRYVINKLKKHNPNVKIIILNCTYSEYDIEYPSPYGNKYSYADYMQASREIAEEYGLKTVEFWQIMKPYFDFKTEKVYYKDFVHCTPKGHEIIFNYLKEQ